MAKTETIEHNLKGLDLLFYPNSHKYKIRKDASRNWKDAPFCPGVTSITGIIDKPALIPWAVGVALKYITERPEEELRRILEELKDPTARKAFLEVAKRAPDAERDEAAKIGHQAHEMAELYSKSRASEIKMDEMHEKAVICFNTFIAWASSNELEPILSEQPVGSIKYKYCGILDCLATINWKGKKVKAIIDYKTSNGVWPEMFAQLGGYLNAYRESFQDETVKMCFILNFPKDGSPMKVYAFDMDDMEKATTFFGNLRRAKAGLAEASAILKEKWKSV